MPGPKMPAASMKGGLCQGNPNVCFIPAPPPVTQVPMVFTSIGDWSTADGAVDKVMFEHKASIVQTSKIKKTKGDEGGTKKGMMSQTNMDEAAPAEASNTVFAGGKAMVFSTCRTRQNGASANVPVGFHTVPSQDKVFVGR